jgi:ligand-binding sensor domain-containing protein
MVIAIGTRKGLWIARPEETGWQLDGPHLPMQEVTALSWQESGDAAPRLLAGVMSPHWGAGLAASDDMGATWSEPSGDAIRFAPADGAALERVWQIQRDPFRPGVVWAGCEPTSLWRSDDDGLSFSLVRGLWDHPHRSRWTPGFGGAAVHTVVPRDEDSVVVAMSTGGVYRSDDDGASWRPTNTGISARFFPDPYPEFGQCVHKVAADGTEPGVLYAQNHGGVYRSDDDGLSWTSIADGLPSDFGFVVVAHPRRAGTAWVVPLVADGDRMPPDAKLRVWRTTDGGATWQPNESGLPDDCWTVVLRDAADVVANDDDDATVVIGTRDGCVYASSDDGRTFELVASHLPDVLCVRVSP